MIGGIEYLFQAPGQWCLALSDLHQCILKLDQKLQFEHLNLKALPQKDIKKKHSSAMEVYKEDVT